MIEDIDLDTLRVASIINQIHQTHVSLEAAQRQLNQLRKRRTLLVEQRKTTNDKVKWRQELRLCEKQIEQARADARAQHQEVAKLEERVRPQLRAALKQAGATLVFWGGKIVSFHTRSNTIIDAKRFASMAEQYEAAEALNNILESLK